MRQPLHLAKPLELNCAIMHKREELWRESLALRYGKVLSPCRVNDGEKHTLLERQREGGTVGRVVIPRDLLA